jgi:hypothetical protein
VLETTKKTHIRNISKRSSITNIDEELSDADSVRALNKAKGRNEYTHIYETFERVSKGSILLYSNAESWLSSEMIFRFLTKSLSAETRDLIVEEMARSRRKREKNVANRFGDAKFIYLVSDIQQSKAQKEAFYKDLDYFTA